MSLRDRINALNASTSTSDVLPAPPSNLRTTSTGASGSIKDKIGKFQANADKEDGQALLPIGRFGESISRRDPSTLDGSSKDKRVASLGGGRAAVPLGPGAVKAGGGIRSTSAGRFSLGGSTIKDDISNPSSSSRSSSIDGSSESNLTGYKTPTDLTPPQSISPPSSTDMVDKVTRRPESISSVDVEPGSVAGESINELNEVDTPTSQSAYASPVSSPIVEPSLTPTAEPQVMVLDEEPIDLLAGHLRGPIAALKEPIRTSSAISVSSMLVEDGSQATEGVANLSEVDNVTLEDEKKLSIDEIPISVGEVEAVEDHQQHTEETDKLREEQTKIELERYEGEVEDIPVAPGLPSMETRQSVPEVVEEEREERILKTPEPTEVFDIEKKTETPVLSTFTTLTTGSDSFPTSVSLASLSSLTSGHTVESDIGDFKMGDVTPELTPKMGLGLDELQVEGENKLLPGGDEFGGLLKNLSLEPKVAMSEPELAVQPPTPGMPKVKCNDCSEEVDLMELADHTCATSSLPPAISSPNLNSAPLPSLSATDLDVPLDDDEPEIAGAFPSPVLTRFTTLSPSRSANTTPAEGSSPKTVTKKSSSKLDSFAPVTRSLVPDDVEEEEDDDEFFGSNTRKGSVGLIPDSPVDVNFRAGFKSMPSLEGSNRLSQVSTSSSDSSAGWSRHALPGGVPGVDDDEEIEDGYEGGSVTIVRSSSQLQKP